MFLDAAVASAMTTDSSDRLALPFLARVDPPRSSVVDSRWRVQPGELTAGVLALVDRSRHRSAG
jgi:hypothetical protein